MLNLKRPLGQKQAPIKPTGDEPQEPSALDVFQYERHRVRTILRDSEPWFVARDVCEILEIADSRNSVNLLDEDDRHTIPVIDSMGRRQPTHIINESGLYSLILRSRKPEAKRFKRWVTHEVLPSIRKYGVYAARVPQTYEDALREIANEIDKRKVLQVENERLILQAAENAPKTKFYDVAMTSGDGLSFAQVAKILNYERIGQNGLFDFCREIKLLQERPRNMPYQKYVDCGYFRVIEQTYERMDGETKISPKTLILQPGVSYIQRRLNEYGYKQRSTKLLLLPYNETTAISIEQ